MDPDLPSARHNIKALALEPSDLSWCSRLASPPRLVSHHRRCHASRQRGTSAIFPPSEEKHKKETTDHHENMLSPYISKQNVDILTVLLPTTNIYPKDRSRHRKSWATSPTNQIPRFADRRPRHFPTKHLKKVGVGRGALTPPLRLATAPSTTPVEENKNKN